MYPENKLDGFVDYKENKLKSENSFEDIDDGYSKSSGSYHSASETCSSSKSTGSESGLASTTSYELLLNSETAQATEVVQKIAVSRAVTNAIFQPDYRISCKSCGPPRCWVGRSGINFLEEHTKNIEDVDNVNALTVAYSKIHMKMSLEKNPRSNDELMLKTHIRNDQSIFPIVLQQMFWINMYEQKIVTLNDDFSAPITLNKYEWVDFYVSVKKFDLSKEYKIVLYYSPLKFMFSKELIIKVTTRPISTMYLEKLDHYFPDPSLRCLDRHHYKVTKDIGEDVDVQNLKQKIVKYERSDAASRLDATNYYAMCKLMLQMEDENESKRSLHHDQFSQKVGRELAGRYSMQINNKRLEAAINEYTRLWITPMSIRKHEITLNGIAAQKKKLAENGDQQREFRVRKDRIYGSVLEIKGNKVIFELIEPLERFTARTRVIPENEEYFVRFMNDRTQITLEHRALDYLKDHNIANVFFPSAECVNKIPMKSEQQLVWDSDDINHEQKLAVSNIIAKKSYPYPYLLFGPPGTGKTKTLIEAIQQIIRNDNHDEYILVCATSNSACNEVAKRLLQSDHCNGKVFRIFSKTAEKKILDIPKSVLAASNLQTGEHYYPSLQLVYQYKIIICTLTTAGRLSQGKIDPKHFSHIFVDEAGSATETQTLIAVAGLSSSNNHIHASLIFAGDPKQLGPLVKSQQALKLGYGVSMIERLITTNSLYMPDASNKFNQNYVTQLIRNYRSHPSILYPSNKLYYDEALLTCAPIHNTDWFLNTDILQNPQFPMLFHSVQGTTIKDHNSPSSYNQHEIDLVMAYLKRIFTHSHRKIVQSDIGIISPYRRQCDALTQKCTDNGYVDIDIGSVETFQGQEKPIIIASMVRSQMNNIGFLDSKKRLNVLMTRAKCLLILIGDAGTLQKNEDWGFVIEHCKSNNSFIE